MIKLEKVTKRWMLRSVIILAVALTIIESLVIFITRDSFYSSAKQTVKTKAAVLQTTLSAYALDTSADFPERIRELVENFSDKDKIFRAYEEAINEKYRFFSFGDAMFIQ